MKRTSFLRTTTFRLAILYAGLFCISVMLLFGIIYWTTNVIAAQDRRETIDADMEGLRRAYLDGGLDKLAETIHQRTQSDRVNDGIYLLAGPNGEPIAGNINGWPARAEIDGDWMSYQVNLELPDAVEVHTAEARFVVLDTGHRVMVGRHLRNQVRFQGAISQAFIGAIAVTLALGVVGGLFMSRTILRRIEAINLGAERIMEGDVRYRMPVRGSGDEFDRLAENLNAMLEEIERLLGSIRSVTNNIAHDLRIPLNRLRNRLEAVLTSDKDAAGQRDDIERAIAEADGLLVTFNALLSIADAEAGTGRSNLEPVDLVALAQDVAELYEPLVEEHGLAFEKVIDGPAVVAGNRQLLFQAIGNLIDNATKYGASGGRVRLIVAGARAGGGPEVVVTDSGPGIPEGDRQRVLERFVRLDTSRSTPGNGLGLSLVAAIARLHNAALSLGDNQPGLKVSLRFKPVPA